MSRRQRNYLPSLSAEWAYLFPYRPEKKDFSDEVVCAVNFLMRQIDPEGKKAAIAPPMPADGVEPQPSARGKRMKEEVEE